MGKIKSIILLALSISLNLQANPYLIRCETKGDMRAAFMRDQKWIKLSENGKTGNCFHVSCPAEQKSILFHSRNPAYKVESASAPVKVSLWVKGEGRGSFGVLSYDMKKGIFYPSGTSSKFDIDSPRQWQKLEMYFTPKAGSQYANNIASLVPFLSIVSGSELYFDDLETEIILPDTEIQIEE